MIHLQQQLQLDGASNLLNAIAAAIANIFRLGFKGLGELGKYAWTCLQTAGYWAEQFVRWPFSVLRGGGAPAPNFTPGQSANELLDEFAERRAQASGVLDLKRDGISTVVSYANATPMARPTIDLSGLEKDVRATLLTMDDNELRALSQAGLSAIRKFIDRREHGVHGVPVVKEVPAGSQKRMDADDASLWAMQTRIRRAAESREFKIARR